MEERSSETEISFQPGEVKEKSLTQKYLGDRHTIIYQTLIYPPSVFTSITRQLDFYRLYKNVSKHHFRYLKRNFAILQSIDIGNTLRKCGIIFSEEQN